MLTAPFSYHKTIDGYLTPAEAQLIYRTAKNLPNNPRAVEIGVWQGKSTFIIGKALAEKNGIIYCIDPFDGSGDIQSEKSYLKRMKRLGSDLENQFTTNMKNGGVWTNIKILKGKSSDFVKSFDKPVNLLFIDGDHGYESVKYDWENWSTKVIPGGYIIMDDIYDSEPILHPGPRQVMEELILPSKEWIIYDQKAAVKVFRRKKPYP